MNLTIDRSTAEGIVRGVMSGNASEDEVLNYMQGHGDQMHHFVVQVAGTLMAAKCVQHEANFRSEASDTINVARSNKALLNLARELVIADHAEDDDLKGCMDEVVLQDRYTWLLAQLLDS